MKENTNKTEPTTAQPKDKAPTTEQPKHNPPPRPTVPDNFIISKEGLNELLQLVEASIQNKYLKNAMYDCINANAKPFYTGTKG